VSAKDFQSIASTYSTDESACNDHDNLKQEAHMSQKNAQHHLLVENLHTHKKPSTVGQYGDKFKLLACAY